MKNSITGVMKNMDKIYNSEFCEAQITRNNQLLYVIWLPANRRMSAREFICQLDALCHIINNYVPAVLFIDAQEYNYPLFNNTIQTVCEFLDGKNLKIGIVDSRHYLGKICMHKMIEQARSKVKMVGNFRTREEGKMWLESIYVSKN